MVNEFKEVQDIIPRNAFLILTAVLAATDVFLLICVFIESTGTPLWMFAATTVIFAAIVLFCFFVKLRISIDDDVITAGFLKPYTVRFEEIIDYKLGDLEVMRNYSGWGIKKVSFKNLICIGYDNGISLKLTGRKVVTISLSDPEKFVSLLPQPQRG